MAALAAARGGVAGKRQAAAPAAQPATVAANKPAVAEIKPEALKPEFKSAAMPAPRAPAAASSAPPWEEDIPLPMDLPDNDFSGSTYDARTDKRTETHAPSAAAPTPVARPKPAAALSVAPQPVPAEPMKLHPDPALNWDGNWPVLAASLPVRGVAHQLAQQSELLSCDSSGAAVQMHLRIPLDTLRSAGSVDKLAAALTEHFGRTVRVETEIGSVRHTASVKAQAEQAARQRLAEQTAQSDPFIQSMVREFGATIVPGSIKPLT
jgi:DNA polymerase-3 subunit gamma/tau